HDEFVDRLVARAAQIKVGDPNDMETDMGPVVSRAQHDRIMSLIRSGEEQGAKIVLGGGVPCGEQFDRGFWVEPTIFVDVTNDMRIAQEEIFGPVLSVLRYHDEDEATRIANDTDYGLSAAVWSTDEDARDTRGPAMEAVTCRGGGDVGVGDKDEPQIVEPTDAILRVTTSAICGTDVHFYKGQELGVVPGTTLGHEFVGVVDEVGA